jgi:phosphoribosylformylglycinamidine synthase subunit PurQ / glutaminase
MCSSSLQTPNASSPARSAQKTVGVVVFPGSNCDQDCFEAVTAAMGLQARYLWYGDVADLSSLEAVILPGGFSYGDYLRCGAIAKQAALMPELVKFAAQGRPVLGICNGFQVLTEAGLLPGALIRNEGLRFLCQRNTVLEVTSTQTVFTSLYQQGQRISLPIAHGDGNYSADADTLARLEEKQQVVFRYAENVNGANNRIAGLCNEKRNVLGMMPHPERNLKANASTAWTGEGRLLFESLLQSVLSA